MSQNTVGNFLKKTTSRLSFRIIWFAISSHGLNCWETLQLWVIYNPSNLFSQRYIGVIKRIYLRRRSCLGLVLGFSQQNPFWLKLSGDTSCFNENQLNMIQEYEFNLGKSPIHWPWEFFSLQTDQWNKTNQASYVNPILFYT